MKKRVSISFFILLLLPVFCSSAILEDDNNLVKLTLEDETVIAPNQQKLTIDISKPVLYAAKQFTLTLNISGPAIFENGLQKKSFSFDEITEDLMIEERISIEDRASGLGEEIIITSDFKYKTSFIGKIDEDFKEYSNLVSFKGVSTDKANCEVQLITCIKDTEQKSDDIETLNTEKTALKDALESITVQKQDMTQKLENCRAEIESGEHICTMNKYFGMSFLSYFFLALSILFAVLYVAGGKNKQKGHKGGHIKAPNRHQFHPQHGSQASQAHPNPQHRHNK